MSIEIPDILIEIKYLVEDASRVSNDDLANLRKVLQLIHYNVRYKAYEKIVKDNIPNLILEIEEEISKAQRNLVDLEIESNNRIVDRGNNKIAAVTRKIQHLEELKLSVVSTNFKEMATQFLGPWFGEQNLIDNCGPSLATGYLDFANFFGEPLVKRTNPNSNFHGYEYNSEALDAVFEVISDKPTMENVQEYVLLTRAKNELSKRLEQQRTSQQITNFTISNFELFDSLDSKWKAIKKFHEQNIANQLHLESKRLGIHLNAGRISRYLDRDKIKDLQEKINDFQTKIEANEKLMNEAKTLQKSLIEKMTVTIPGFTEDKFDSFFYYRANRDPFTYSNTRNEGGLFDGKPSVETLTKYDESYRREIAETEPQLKSKESEIKNYKLTMNPRSVELVENHYETCDNLVSLVSRPERYGKTPIISAFVLKALSDAKYITRESLEPYINQESPEFSMLEKKYAEQIEKVILESRNKLDNITEEDTFSGMSM